MSIALDLYLRNRSTFNLIKNGTKTIEIRINKGKMLSIGIDSLLNLICREEQYRVRVKKIEYYPNWEEFIEKLELKKTFPLLNTKREVYPYLLNYYNTSQIQKYGLLAICFH